MVICEPVGGHGGMDYYDLSLGKALSQAGVSPLLLTCDKTDEADAGFTVRKVYKRIFGADPAWKRGLRFLQGSLEGFIRARLEGARIAHFHFFHVGALELFNVLLARVLGMRVVITAHDVEAFKPGLSSRKMVDWVYGLAAGVIAHNQISRKELIEKLGIPSERIHVIRHGNYDGYGVTANSRNDACRAIGVEPDEFVVMFFGQIKEVKGLDVLLQAMPDVIERAGRPVRLVVAGKVWKDDFSKYQRLIDELRIAAVVKLDIRYIPDSELPCFYRAADVLVLPYRRIYQSGVVLMAMTFGAPVIVSDIPGMLEVVTHERNGLVFRSGDSADLAHKISWAIVHETELEMLAVNAKKLMQTDYDWAGIGIKTADLYRKLLAT